MNARIAMYWSLALVITLGGCNTLSRQPHLSEVSVSPNPVAPGQTVVLKVRVSCIDKVVHRMEATVREEPRFKLSLKDDGVAPDVKANDGVWTRSIEIPFTAPPGSLNLDIRAFNRKGSPLKVKAAGDKVVPLTATCQVTIAYPPK